MKSLLITICLMIVCTTAQAQMTKKGKTVEVNTTTLCKKKGFKSTTPLIVTFQRGKILSITPLKNMETPQIFAKVKTQMLPRYKGMKATKAAKANVDGVTGATLSSNAVRANVQAAARYYNTHK